MATCAELLAQMASLQPQVTQAMTDWVNQAAIAQTEQALANQKWQVAMTLQNQLTQLQMQYQQQGCNNP